MSKLISRSEFRAVLKSVVRCLRGELNAPGLTPLTAEEIHFWFRNITLEDLEVVNKEIDAEAPVEPGHPSRVQSMLQKIREKMRGGDAGEPANTGSEEEPEVGPSEKPN